ncbi:TRAP transporter large permease [Clostridium bowmanii]|uniref:TRAP transporter large permease n=1 Tax=Clostridium bowmanii TaxID=132925 RepID=UPI001C0E3F98|nr:TRAP transporter large permease [Clostridium bowmanii]MBU3191941.1 TRAP transporter large permease [Clostridium bowmanii]MCA1074502.1 TRAP transporter large permease [Clostridium bowmanii]
MAYYAFQVGLVILITCIVLLSLGVPISVSMGVGAVLAIFVVLAPDKVAVTSAQRIYTGINSFSLLAIPFFILSGSIMNNGGIAKKLINFAKTLIGSIPGALALTNVVGNMFFGAISGSGVAAAAAIGGVVGPLEKEENYDPAYSAAVNIASAPCGMLIPPSNTFIVYSLASGGASIAALFVAGYIPGILWGLTCMIIAYIGAKKLGYKPSPISGVKAKFKTFIEAIPALFLIVIIVGGILGGIFTPTEASCVSVVYALILSACYRTLTLKDLYRVFLESAKTTGMIIFMIGVSAILSWIMSFTKIPTLIASSLMGVTDNKVLIMLMINTIMLFMGCVMDPTPAILIFTPIFLPIAQGLGYNVIHFGVIMVFNFCIGTITPPVGPILFTGCKVANLKIENVIRRLLPYFAAEVVLLLVVTFIPEISLLIPKLLGLM